MGIAAQLREAADPREGSVEIMQEAMGHAAIVGDGVAAQGQSESLDVRFESLFETGLRLAHGICGVDCACGSRRRAPIRARYLGAPVGRRAWWCGSGRVP